MAKRLANSVPRTRAWKQMRDRIDAHELTQDGIAAAAEVSQPSVHAWVRRKSRPKLPIRFALERKLGIASDDWLTDSEFFLAYGRRRYALAS